MSAYEKEHMSQGWRRPPLLDLPSSHFIIDVLHLKMSMVKMLFRHSIIPSVTTEAIADKMNEFFDANGIFR